MNFVHICRIASNRAARRWQLRLHPDFGGKPLGRAPTFALAVQDLWESMDSIATFLFVIIILFLLFLYFFIFFSQCARPLNLCTFGRGSKSTWMAPCQKHWHQSPLVEALLSLRVAIWNCGNSSSASVILLEVMIAGHEKTHLFLRGCVLRVLFSGLGLLWFCRRLHPERPRASKGVPVYGPDAKARLVLFGLI